MPTLKEVNAKMPELKASPRVNPTTGKVADFLKYLKSPKSSQQMQGLMSVLPFVDDLEQVLDDASYGRAPIQGKGMTLNLTPEGKSMVELATIFAPGGRAASQAVESGAMALGRVGEQYAERKVPQIMAQGGRPAQLLSDLARGTVSPATVYHGSPHKFTKFDSSKIGTGEGAQAYGQGLYLGEIVDVAKGYAPRDTGFEDVLMKAYSNAERSGDYASAQILEEFLTHKTPSQVKETLSEFSGQDLDKAKKAYDFATSAFKKQKESFLYQVDLPDEQIAKMLDYDKPLSKQSEYVKQQLLDLIEYEGLPEYLRKDIIEERGLNTGQRVYGELAKLLGSDKAASEALRQAGIPGLRYLDEGSRGVGKGSSNFVVFPGTEDMLTIEKINENPMDLILKTLKK